MPCACRQQVIQQFQREGARQQRYVKQLLGLLGTILAAVYFVFAVHQVRARRARAQRRLRFCIVKLSNGPARLVFY